MALIHCDFFSHILGLCMEMDVILPQPAPYGSKGSNRKRTKKYPILYLLHGMSDNHTIWQRRTSIERYVENLELAVVMPAVHRSFYTDMASGFKFGTYISDELPYIIKRMFPISEERGNTFVAGLSMGGYGSFKLALSHPERFFAAASFSGALNIARNIKVPKDADDSEVVAWHKELTNIFGNLRKVPGSDNDLFALSSRLVKSGQEQPMLYQWCGTEDFLYQDNILFKEHAERIGLKVNFAEGPGDHRWQYWDEQIKIFLGMLPLKATGPSF